MIFNGSMIFWWTLRINWKHHPQGSPWTLLMASNLLMAYHKNKRNKKEHQNLRKMRVYNLSLNYEIMISIFQKLMVTILYLLLPRYIIHDKRTDDFWGYELRIFQKSGENHWNTLVALSTRGPALRSTNSWVSNVVAPRRLHWPCLHQKSDGFSFNDSSVCNFNRWVSISWLEATVALVMDLWTTECQQELRRRGVPWKKFLVSFHPRFHPTWGVHHSPAGGFTGTAKYPPAGQRPPGYIIYNYHLLQRVYARYIPMVSYYIHMNPMKPPQIPHKSPDQRRGYRSHQLPGAAA